MKVWPHVTNGIQWSINNGRNTHFWTDRWVDNGVVLIDHAINISGVNPNLRVAEVCSVEGEWNLNFLLTNLPHDTVMQVIGMSPPRDSLGEDALSWGLEPKGSFSVRSAYLLLSEIDDTARDQFWNKVWKWNGPNKIRHFLWLVSHDQLMTNVERQRRHLTTQVNCSRCALQAETISHALFDCRFAIQVWEAVLPEAVRVMDIHRDFFTWWKCMLTDGERGTKFGIIAWLLWKARNKLIFDKEKQSVSAIIDQCGYWTNLVLSSWKTNQLGQEARGIARQAQLIAWWLGEEGWSTLNTDGSRSLRTGATAIGGLIRSEHGIFVQAFCANIGNCSITRAEIKAIVEGTKIAWSLGIRKLNIQSDSRVAVGILSSDPSIAHQHRALVAEFHEYRNRQWEVSLSHVYCEANFAADYLASLGHSFNFGFQHFLYPDSGLAYWLRYDLLGVCSSRPAPVNNI
ncbi:Putative ribonuclease H protein At1g65750 [Linum perenne]